MKGRYKKSYKSPMSNFQKKIFEFDIETEVLNVTEVRDDPKEVDDPSTNFSNSTLNYVYYVNHV